MAKKKTNSQPSAQPVDANDITYEQAVEQLESIIDRIESGEVGLEDSLKEYERGTELLKRCRAILSQTEQRVTELTQALGDDSEKD